MTEERFWQLIEASKRGVVAGDDDEWEQREENLKQLLLDLPPEEIVGFEFYMRRMLNRAFRWDLWGAGYIVNGGCSDDGFLYFRIWLVAQGSEVYNEVLENPSALAKYIEPDTDADWETFGYVAHAAFQQATGKGGWDEFDEFIPDDEAEPMRFEPAGEQWNEEDLPQLFPELWLTFGWEEDDEEEDDESGWNSGAGWDDSAETEKDESIWAEDEDDDEDDDDDEEDDDDDEDVEEEGKWQ